MMNHESPIKLIRKGGSCYEKRDDKNFKRPSII